MIATDEDALACDFMETYGIMDFRMLPVQKAATLAAGLRADSRIKMLINGDKIDKKTLLLGSIADALNILVWFQSEDGAKKINRPASIVKMILGEKETKNDVIGFNSAEEFEKERTRILRGL